MFTISQLFIYPIKSLGGFDVESAPLTDRGMQYDRRWMLVDSNNQYLTQREFAQMSLLQTAIEGDRLLIYHKNDRADKLSVDLQPIPGAATTVKLWDDECEAHYVSEIADDWFSHHLSIPCRLMYMPDSVKRKVNENYAHENEITAFSDGYPLTIIGQASLDDLNSRLTEQLLMNRFRPNIVFTGGEPYEEDTMEQLRINGISLFGVKLCPRCTITTINQADSAKGKEPLKTLANYRMKNNNVYFGQNLLFKGSGMLKVGDSIEVISRKPAASF